MPHSVLAVANEFLDAGNAEGVPLTPMHLQKLCYLAHGFGLAFIDDILIGDRLEAWTYGPVYPALYDALKSVGSGPVTDLIHERNWAILPSVRGEVVREDLSDRERDVVKRVYETYARFPAFQLSAITHEDDSPWHKVYNSGQRNGVIPNDLMREYFRGLATAR